MLNAALSPDGATSSLLELRNISKAFHGVPAVRNVSLEVAAGETLALVGENGAGKSTLMKVIAGIYPVGSYEGEMYLNGVQVQFRGIREAEAAGVVLVPQELHIAPNLSISENMFMGMLPGRFGWVDRPALRQRAKERLAFFGVDADPDAPAGILSPSAQRLVTIAAALSKSATRILILDEPTASLTDGEAVHLFERMKQVQADGVGCIYITHRLDEIERVTEKIVVMRNGERVADFSTARGNRSQVVRAMIGRDPEPQAGRPERSRGEAILTVSNLTVREPFGGVRPRVDNVGLTLHKGEILGLFGLVGAGRTELAKAVFGAWRGGVEGQMTLGTESGLPRSPQDAIRRGLAMLTEDRKQTGLIERQSVLFNTSAASIDFVTRLGFLDLPKERNRNDALIRRLDLRPPNLDAKVETFSGGNQQKVLLARWIATKPRVLIVDEPTYGVDVGARFEIYKLLREIGDEGCGILMISSDMNEILTESDRILVMYKGRITGEFSPGATRHELMTAATGEDTCDE